MLQEGFINKSAVEHHLDVDVLGLGSSGLPALSRRAPRLRLTLCATTQGEGRWKGKMSGRPVVE